MEESGKLLMAGLKEMMNDSMAGWKRCQERADMMEEKLKTAEREWGYAEEIVERYEEALRRIADNKASDQDDYSTLCLLREIARTALEL